VWNYANSTSRRNTGLALKLGSRWHRFDLGLVFLLEIGSRLNQIKKNLKMKHCRKDNINFSIQVFVGTDKEKVEKAAKESCHFYNNMSVNAIYSVDYPNATTAVDDNYEFEE
jgi:hypothetical protein